MIENLTTFYISSKTNKLNSTDTDGNFNVKIDLSSDNFKEITHCSVTDISIPTTYYTIQSPFNTFKVKPTNAANYTIVTINSGCYNSTTLSNVLSSAIGTVLGNPNFRVFLDTINGNLVFVNALSVTLFTILVEDSRMSLILGIPLGVPQTSQIVVNESILFGSSVANISGLGVLYLTCDQIQSNNNTQGMSNILTAIHNQGDAAFTYDHEKYDMIYNMKPISGVSQIWNFRVVDEFKNLIDFNGVPISFTLNLFKYNTSVFLPFKQK